MRNSRLYEQDFYAWANEQAALLRAGRLSEAGISHVAEEIESRGKAEKRELVSWLKVLLLHLLKWQFQPTMRETSWRLAVKEQRREASDHLDDNPSLRAAIGLLALSRVVKPVWRRRHSRRIALGPSSR